jgi:hypothetical protein
VLLFAFAAWNVNRLGPHLAGDAQKAPGLQGKNEQEKDIELKPVNFAAVLARAQELARLP